MTEQEKLTMLKALMRMEGNEEDNVLMAYLNAAEREILAWKYSLSARPMPSSVDLEDEMTQVQAVIAGYNLVGAENESSHNENGINRVFEYANMVAFIRANVMPVAGVR